MFIYKKYTSISFLFLIDKNIGVHSYCGVGVPARMNTGTDSRVRSEVWRDGNQRPSGSPLWRHLS